MAPPYSSRSHSLTSPRLRLLSMLLTLLVVVVSCAATSAAPSILRAISPGVFQIVKVSGDNISSGTAFLNPGTCTQVITAAHVVDGADILMVRKGGSIIPMRVIKKGDDKGDDIALLATEVTPEGEFANLCDTFSPLKWAKGKPDVGEMLWYLGVPAVSTDLIPGPAWMLALSPAIDPQVGFKGVRSLLSAPSFLPGQSGSPLFNEAGELVGMMNGVIWTEKGPGAMAYSTPAQIIQNFIR